MSEYDVSSQQTLNTVNQPGQIRSETPDTDGDFEQMVALGGIDSEDMGELNRV